ncbi:hypothetical protein QTH97_31850 [Variovorax sp. J22R24]|uniref:hypothetical protein n=1 Tax=Variovorax TaxID=34072 RepID=UPI002576BCBE|nr:MULTISPECIES: hypothetical protein [unclassified Variovorax]MDM0077005.1 hypothetical protein [Variovorax sp. J2P1-59]MDM0109557.1 hypothetical protein [Variovorax sp. J22R24]
MTDETSMHNAVAFELRFQSLYQLGRALSFPCDCHGHVDLDHCSERARNNYLFARAMMGREYEWPRVTPCPGTYGAGDDDSGKGSVPSP